VRICRICNERQSKKPNAWICSSCAFKRRQSGETNPPRPWTTKDAKFALENYPKADTKWLAKTLNRTEIAVRMFCEKRGVYRDPDYSNVDRFVKGQKPWNTGLKGFRPEGSKKTYFKPGQKPANAKGIGEERIRSGTLYRKVCEGQMKKNWKPVKDIVWESINGPIPEGKWIVIANGDTTDCRPENLLCLTRKEMLARNSHKNAEARSAAMRKGWETRRRNGRGAARTTGHAAPTQSQSAR